MNVNLLKCTVHRVFSYFIFSLKCILHFITITTYTCITNMLNALIRLNLHSQFSFHFSVHFSCVQMYDNMMPHMWEWIFHLVYGCPHLQHPVIYTISKNKNKIDFIHSSIIYGHQPFRTHKDLPINSQLIISHIKCMVEIFDIFAWRQCWVVKQIRSMWMN